MANLQNLEATREHVSLKRRPNRRNRHSHGAVEMLLIAVVHFRYAARMERITSLGLFCLLPRRLSVGRRGAVHSLLTVLERLVELHWKWLLSKKVEERRVLLERCCAR